MTRFVVDCGVVLHLASEGAEAPAEHELLAPTLLRSQTLSALHEAVHEGETAPAVALDRLTRIWAMPIRLLGDAVLRRRAWELAEQLGWAETYDAEYVALTQLQADAVVTLDADLARRVAGIVPTATIEALRTARVFPGPLARAQSGKSAGVRSCIDARELSTRDCCCPSVS
jgi:predicted nucleic acid-binding protein